MRSNRWMARLVWLACLIGTAGFAAHLVAGDRSQLRDSALLRQAHELDLQGAADSRLQTLNGALDASGDDPAIRGHLGQVRHDRHWLDYEDAAAGWQRDARLAEYRQRREAAAPTLLGQAELAAWCATKKLPDQERAHWTAVLQFDPDYAQARARLGYQWVDGAWMSKDERLRSATNAQRAAQDLARWTPEMKRLLRSIEQNDDDKRDEAAQRLAEIEDPSAILAMEAVLCRGHQQAAKLAVRTIARMPQPEASLALARQAVFTPWPEVGALAAEQLRDRPEDAYVPALLSLMSTPIGTRYELFQQPSGRLTYEHQFYREGQELRELSVLRRTVSFRQADGALAGVSSPSAVGAKQQAAQALAAQAAAREIDVNRQNFNTVELNGRIGDVLARATGVELPNDPRTWWTWWIEHNELIVLGDKAVETAINVQQGEVRLAGKDAPRVTPVQMEPSYFQSHTKGDGKYISVPDLRRQYTRLSNIPRRPLSCLVAGTRIWTEQGLRAINNLQPGDMVLAQHPLTGELAYKPVLQTTVRPKVEVLSLKVEGETIRATGGHLFWVLGQGWVRTRSLDPGMRLFTARGSAAVEEVLDEGQAEPTYNLIVADAHSYFVSEAMILSHDNTLRQPTLGPTPGLAAAP